MEDQVKPETTPRFGQSSQNEFLTLLKNELQKQKPNIKYKIEYNSSLNNSKIAKNSNLHENLNLKKSSNNKKELAIGRWFCDYPEKRLELRNDYDQEHSNKFLQEKEKAFEKLDLCDDLLLNNNSCNSNCKN